MLLEHLSQAHDAASRRFAIIDQHVEWIHKALLSSRPTKILDLGCGPGLYTERLAVRGHSCVGIDYSPASIAYAEANAQKDDLSCSYLLEDMRHANFGDGYGLVTLLFGEFNVFRPRDCREILRKAYATLQDGGHLLLEVHTFDAIHNRGEKPSTWYSAEKGLFSPKPHLCLQENFWDPHTNTTTVRYYIIEEGEKVFRYAQTLQAYTEDETHALLRETGFGNLTFYPSMTGVRENEAPAEFFALVAEK
jgi:SAM-dependent methyltransferase